MSLGAFLRRASHATGKLDASRPYITMWDDITVSSLPSGGSYAYAGYTAGLWPTFHELERRFPGHRLLDIAVFASDNATCLDIERGDATIAEAPAWFERQVARGVYRPVLYIQASGLKGLEQVMAAHHIPRHAYRIWSAHYTNKAHLCAPKSCGYGLSEADGCQWTSTALGINLDRSLLLPNFFDPRPAPPKPPTPKPATPSWQEAMLNALPTLKQGDKDGPGKIEFVGRMQVLIKFIGKTNKIEAASTLDEHTSDDYAEFGPHTVNALLAVQAFFGLHNTSEYQQRVCGPQTWAALITAHA